MKQEQLAMESIQKNYSSGSVNLSMISGADSDELAKRFEILIYGYEARTRTALFEWSKQLIQAIGEQAWNQLGLDFIKSQTSSEPQIGKLALDFFKWLKTKPLSEKAQIAADRDEAFYHCQNNWFNEDRLILTPQLLLETPILLQESTIVIYSQNLVVSRDRKEFYLQQLSLDFIQILKKLDTQAVQLNSVLSGNLQEDQLVQFLITGIQKKWFQRID